MRHATRREIGQIYADAENKAKALQERILTVLEMAEDTPIAFSFLHGIVTGVEEFSDTPPGATLDALYILLKKGKVNRLYIGHEKSELSDIALMPKHGYCLKNEDEAPNSKHS